MIMPFLDSSIDNFSIVYCLEIEKWANFCVYEYDCVDIF
jgi:hypothetical protein